MAEGIFFKQNSSFVGPGSLGARLLEDESGSYTGPWIPVHEFARFSAVFSGVGTAAGSITLYGANTDGEPGSLTDPGVFVLDTQSFSSSAQTLTSNWQYPVRWVAAVCNLTAGTVWAFLQATTP
jgi:hypothetical protein